MEAELVKRAGIPFRAIPAAGLHGVGVWALPRNLLRLARGTLAARRILRAFRPEILFYTGGYVAGPMALAGRQIPSLLFVPDIEPGVALKSLARFAARIAVTTPDSRPYFSKPVVVTGYPVRPELAGWDRSKGRRALGLDPELPTLMIWGGSKGARSINLAVVPNLPYLLEKAQVVHISGEADWPVIETARAGLMSEQKGRYHPHPYLHEEMGAALASADLVVSRAGASILGEYPFFGLPAVLVPYPHAWRYQRINAEYLAQHGAAVILKDEFLSQELLTAVKDLLENPAKLAAMRQAMRSLAQPHAAQAIAAQLLALGEQGL
jgi:UDP-N-acetylglucosamine--N-acetylmuramyl-(pentapeptide) pyrophosphoryl-undecaprenol N-acetylglucosamine transferase